MLAVAVRVAPDVGSVDVNTVVTPRAETFYWITITFSQTLGTALGDWIADAGLGYAGGALVFGAGLADPRDPLFRDPRQPCAAVLGGLHPDPAARGDGRRLPRQASRERRTRSQPPGCDGGLGVAIVALIILIPQRPGRHPGEAEA